MKHDNDKSTYALLPEDFAFSQPTPHQTAVALRFTAALAFLCAFIFGLQGGWLALVCMALTLGGVFFAAMSKMVERQ